MKKSDHFTWTPEAQEALDSLKNILKSPPILTALTTEEPMLLYISVTTQVVSAALVVEREEPRRSQKVQRPVYFISEVLSDSKTRYSQMQKLVYAILMTKRKLRYYFDAHPITIMSKYPLGEVIQNPEAEERIAKWALELMGRTSRMLRAAQSNPKYSRTLWPSGRRFKLPQRRSDTRLGPCISMARS
jgi:hypothetical protein